MERDSSIILSGTAGLLYIMFLAGLEINLADFKKNSTKSLLFGMYTFLIPMILGLLSGLYILHFSMASSVLLASMFASHTLIAYPIISKYGVAKNRAVTVGGTMITDTLSLLVLAIIVGMTTGEVNTEFWIRLSVSIIIFALIIILLFPIIARWFFKNFKDSVSQYIFVLAMVFLGAVLAEIAGIEGIIGAFLAGLSLNRLIPSTSPLMNRIEFVGNAIFIPFFLIGVGMLVDYRAFFRDFETIKVATVMTVVAIAAKYAAAWLTQKSLKYTTDERSIIFGLSNAQAAATLAAVTVGYNIILGHTASGEPIRLLNESVLNGTIVMILITCTIASFSAQKGARNISLKESAPDEEKENENVFNENILIPVRYPENIEELINLGTLIKKKENKRGFHALSVINNQESDPDADKQSEKILEKAQKAAAAADIRLHTLLRYDSSVGNAITSVIKENKVTDLILGLHIQKELSGSFLGNLTEHILENSNVTTFIYKPVQPVATIKRHLIVIPKHAESELGFPFWVVKMWKMALNTGSKLIFYGAKETIGILQDIQKNNHIEAEFRIFDDWNDFLIISRDMQSNDSLIIVMSRKNKASYQQIMKKIPGYLNKYFNAQSFILIYPMQLEATGEDENTDLLNPSLLANGNNIESLGKSISRALTGK
jgi:Kef-type K+ transport system membrane component KefB/nucleotide-binding universal stress UspA family protein